MFCWLVPWRYRMFQMLWLDYNHNRGVIGTRVVWRWQGSNPNNPSTHDVRFHFLEGNWKCQMPVRTEEFDRATAEVIGTFDGVEEIWEGIVNNYLKKDISAVLPTGCGKSLLFQLKHLAYAMSKKGISRQHKTVTSCQNAAFSNEFFSPAGRLSSEQIFINFAVCFILRGQDTLIDFLRFISGRHDFRLLTVLFFSVRSSRSRALLYGLPILHECQNYLGGRGISKRSHEKKGTVTSLAWFALWCESRAFSLTSFET